MIKAMFDFSWRLWVIILLGLIVLQLDDMNRESARVYPFPTDARRVKDSDHGGL